MGYWNDIWKELKAELRGPYKYDGLVKGDRTQFIHPTPTKPLPQQSPTEPFYIPPTQQVPHSADFVGFPRVPTQKDLEQWLAAAAQQSKEPNVRHVQFLIQSAYPERWKRLQDDYRWLQDQLQGMGIDVEEARWYL